MPERAVPNFDFYFIPILLRARGIQDALLQQTWLRSDNLFPELRRLRVPTLIIHGDYDFIPTECASHIAEAIPGARFVILKDTGHFAYMESPNEARKEIDAFLA